MTDRNQGGPTSKHVRVHVYKKIKILVMDLEEPEARNDCAGESQQQLN
jgi:hypothetical protein